MSDDRCWMLANTFLGGRGHFLRINFELFILLNYGLYRLLRAFPNSEKGAVTYPRGRYFEIIEQSRWLYSQFRSVIATKEAI
jgi:hypothetical protein